MADVENPDPDVAAGPEADDESGCAPVCVGACLTSTILAVSGVLVLLYCRSAHASTAVQVLAAIGLGVALGCFLLGALFCVVTVAFCLYGNYAGKPQPDVAAVD